MLVSADAFIKRMCHRRDTLCLCGDTTWNYGSARTGTAFRAYPDAEAVDDYALRSQLELLRLGERINDVQSMGDALGHLQLQRVIPSPA